MASFDIDNYVTVDERITKFYEKHPEGRIVTDLGEWTENGIIVKAYIYRDRSASDTRPDATGYAHEVPGRGMTQKTHPLETAETSAIGRGLANLGIKTRRDEPRPSREEMQSAREGEDRHAELIERIKQAGSSLPSNATLNLSNGETVTAKDFLRDNWEQITQNATFASHVIRELDNLEDK